jgi:flagellar hook assembly protein FlgD
LTGLIATLEAETTVLILEAGRLNILAELAQLEMGALNAIINKTQSELNLILGPLASTQCLDLQNLIGKLQNSATGKVLIAVQNYIYKIAKYNSLYQAKLAQIAQNNQLVTWCNNFISAINQICS